MSPAVGGFEQRDVNTMLNTFNTRGKAPDPTSGMVIPVNGVKNTYQYHIEVRLSNMSDYFLTMFCSLYSWRLQLTNKNYLQTNR